MRYFKVGAVALIWAQLCLVFSVRLMRRCQPAYWDEVLIVGEKSTLIIEWFILWVYNFRKYK